VSVLGWAVGKAGVCSDEACTHGRFLACTASF